MFSQSDNSHIALRILQCLERADDSTEISLDPALLPLDAGARSACLALCHLVDDCRRDIVAGAGAHGDRSSVADQFEALAAAHETSKIWISRLAQALARVVGHGIGVTPVLCDSRYEAEQNPDWEGGIVGRWLHLRFRPVVHVGRIAERD